jgi:lipid-A-disaccharide synthase-like uncharacterized protein
MNILTIIAITWIGKEYRFLGLDWSYLMVLGFIGNALFSMRFLVQWLASERQGESVIPVSFWYWSIAGSALMCVYFIFRRDPVGILAYLPNSMIYIRNLMLIRKRKFAFTAAAPSQHPREENVRAEHSSSGVAWLQWRWVLWLLGIIVALAILYFWAR